MRIRRLRVLWSLPALAALWSAPLGAQTYPIDQFQHPGGLPDGGFGGALDIDGTRLLVGGEDGAWIFERTQAGSWKMAADLGVLIGAPTGEFGAAVALDGDRAVVGAPTDAPFGTLAGSIYVFDRAPSGQWTLGAKLFLASSSLDARFGLALDVDGDRLAVGAPFEFSPFAPERTGVVHLFERLPSGAWALDGTLGVVGATINQRIGWSVALDGTRLLAAGPGTISLADQGRAWIFDRAPSGNWLLSDELVAAGIEPADLYGAVVDLDGDRAAIGAPWADATTVNAGAAHVFDRAGSGAWSETARLVSPELATGPQFGDDLDLEGDRLLIGAKSEPFDGIATVGGAHLFERSQAFGWTHTERFLPVLPPAGPFAGEAVALGEGWVALGSPTSDTPVIDAGRVELSFGYAATNATGPSLQAGGTPGCNAKHAIDSTLPPLIGTADFALRTTDAPPSCAGVLVLASSQDVAGSDPLGLGFTLNVDLFGSVVLLLLEGTSDASGLSEIGAPIPFEPNLFSLQLTAQSVWLGPPCPTLPLGISSSSVVTFRIQTP